MQDALTVPAPLLFMTLDDARAWFDGRELWHDFVGIEEGQAPLLSDVARAIVEIEAKFPQLRSRPDWRLGGVGTYQSAKVSARVRKFGANGAAVCDNRTGKLGDPEFLPYSGPYIWLNDNFLGEEPSLYAEIGFTCALDVYEGMIHELGHAVLSCTPHLEQTARRCFHEIWNTPRLRKRAAKDISVYGMSTRDEEFYAEAFTRLHAAGCWDRTPTEAGRKRLRRFQKMVNAEIAYYSLSTETPPRGL